MALHGPICINGQDIGAWQARRTADIAEPHPNTYECVVEYWGKPAARFTIEHHYDDGASALIAALMTRYTELTKETTDD